MANCCCPDRGGQFAMDEFCGNFTIDCLTNTADPAFDLAETVWTSSFSIDAGTISVFYDTGCADPLTVYIANGGVVVGTFTIPLATLGSNGNTRSVTVQTFDEVRIICNTDAAAGNSCRGKYCINANYRL
ncbi:S-Ena type endospore appendage [Halobacillus sp. Cin3]|uniref:S-Ena type endospore appendage n=1 Tax=Halobacillus sp. Cin3 TaxID=2928441 RepID=UPI00248DE6AF|nr:S-Ena type endospore appendage [Halobacillus sp. Cin3]